MYIIIDSMLNIWNQMRVDYAVKYYRTYLLY